MPKRLSEAVRMAYDSARRVRLSVMNEGRRGEVRSLVVTRAEELDIMSWPARETALRRSGFDWVMTQPCDRSDGIEALLLPFRSNQLSQSALGYLLTTLTPLIPKSLLIPHTECTLPVHPSPSASKPSTLTNPSSSP